MIEPIGNTHFQFTFNAHKYQNTEFPVTDSDITFPRQLSPEVLQALRGVRFIAQHIKDADKDNEVTSRKKIKSININICG